MARILKALYSWNFRQHKEIIIAAYYSKLVRRSKARPSFKTPDQVQSDFHVFGPLKETLRGKRYTADDKVKLLVQRCLDEQPS